VGVIKVVIDYIVANYMNAEFWVHLFTYLTTCSVAVNTIRKRTERGKYLSGKWAGTLKHYDRNGNLVKSNITKCNLIVAESNGSSFSSYMYYEKLNISNGKEIVARGFDDLLEPGDASWFLLKRQWKPMFHRVFHIDNTGVLMDDASFELECEAINYPFKYKMNVFAKLSDECHVRGTLEKY